MSIEDVRALHDEADRLENESTDLRVEADMMVKREWLCRDIDISGEAGRHSTCCGLPYACAGREWA